MFILALLLINPVTKTSEVERKAEFLIILDWDKNSSDDIDLWIEDPVGNVLSFKNKTSGLMHLDKDDLGKVNDIIYLPDGTSQIIELNREVATFRGWVKGEYAINVHMYSKRDVIPTNATVTMLRVILIRYYSRNMLFSLFAGRSIPYVVLRLIRVGMSPKQIRITSRL